MARVDLEAVCVAIEAFMKQQLNAKIAALNTEKGDSITLSDVPDTAYYFSSFGSEMGNFDPCILYGVKNIEVIDSQGGAAIEKNTVQIYVIKADNGNDKLIARRMLRYQRALKEIFQEKWNSVLGSLHFKIFSLAPDALPLLNRDYPDQLIGIELEFHLA
jgi:hypothetical protein